MNLQEAHKRRSIGELFQNNTEGAEVIFKRFGDLKSIYEILTAIEYADAELRTQARVALFFLEISDVSLREIEKNLSHESRIAFLRALATYFEIEIKIEDLC